MQSFRSFVGFAAGAIAGVLSLAALPAYAQRAAPTQLTPYRLASSEGLCVTVGTQKLSQSWWIVDAEPCSETNSRQLFYILAENSDIDFVWQTQTPQAVARIVWADVFDNPSNAMYSYLDKDVLVLDGNDGPPWAGTEWYIKQAPKASTWTPVGVSGSTFGIAGQRKFKYTASEGQLFRTVQGIDPGINGSGQCTDAFFGPLPGMNKSCWVEGADRRDTPVQVQLFGALYPTDCLGYYAGSANLNTSSTCDAASPTRRTVWSLVPAKYPQ